MTHMAHRFETAASTLLRYPADIVARKPLFSEDVR